MIQMTAQPQVESIENSTSYGKFEIEPLEPGFGITLGNALRRVLLRALEGAAVTSVSIEGVAHEFARSLRQGRRHGDHAEHEGI